MKENAEPAGYDMPDLETDPNTATRRERTGNQAALQHLVGPVGRIHKGAVNDELVEVFRRYQWTSHVILETACSADTLAQMLDSYKRVPRSSIERWFEADEFFHRACLALAK